MTSIRETDIYMQKNINASSCRLLCYKRWEEHYMLKSQEARSIIFYQDNDDAKIEKEAFGEELYVHTTFWIVERPVS